MQGEGSLQIHQQQLINSARQLLEHTEPIRNAAKREAENLGHLVSVSCFRRLFLYYSEVGYRDRFDVIVLEKECEFFWIIVLLCLVFP